MYSQRHIDRQDIHAVGGVVGDLGDGLADDASVLKPSSVPRQILVT